MLSYENRMSRDARTFGELFEQFMVDVPAPLRFSGAKKT
jgi:hypothetical protein